MSGLREFLLIGRQYATLFSLVTQHKFPCCSINGNSMSFYYHSFCRCWFGIKLCKNPTLNSCSLRHIYNVLKHVLFLSSQIHCWSLIGAMYICFQNSLLHDFKMLIALQLFKWRWSLKLKNVTYKCLNIIHSVMRIDQICRKIIINVLGFIHQDISN